VTQKNAAMVEEAADASESMDEQSSNLTQLMEFFSIGNTSKIIQARPARDPATSRPAPSPAPARSPAPAPKSSGGDMGDEWEQF
ncbi:hypothetical protein, partial [Mangrovimicrobium sediminis]|uniref:hypothetical protein n=1 Tax=Mangrovimicrobium sediminis TaxID=2562682 RepID=UPI003EB91455